jgi:hypothetical protein
MSDAQEEKQAKRGALLAGIAAGTLTTVGVMNWVDGDLSLSWFVAATGWMVASVWAARLARAGRNKELICPRGKVNRLDNNGNN